MNTALLVRAFQDGALNARVPKAKHYAEQALDRVYREDMLAAVLLARKAEKLDPAFGPLRALISWQHAD